MVAVIVVTLSAIARHKTNKDHAPKLTRITILSNLRFLVNKNGQVLVKVDVAAT